MGSSPNSSASPPGGLLVGATTAVATVEGALPKARKYAMYGSLAGSALSLLVMGIAGHMVFNLSAEDYLFGDACGGSPPSARMLGNYVSSSDISDIRYNSSTPSPSPSSDSSSKSDGSSCESSYQCTGVCSGGRCMLSEFGDGYVRDTILSWTLFDGFCMIILFLAVPIILTAQRAYFPGVWRVTLCFISMACVPVSAAAAAVALLTLRLANPQGSSHDVLHAGGRGAVGFFFRPCPYCL